MSIADELITRGWRKGAIVRNGEVCLLGAAGCAYGQGPQVGYDLADEFPGVLRALQLAIGLDCEPNDDKAVWYWNDDPDRTYDEVLRVAKIADEFLADDA